MAKKYNPIIDNYLLSIPSEPQEEWRVNLQGIYDSMRITVTDIIAIDGQYYDVHDELSEDIDHRFGIDEARVIVGLRKLVFSDFIPFFITKHTSFLELVETLAPPKVRDSNKDQEYQRSANKILETYKELIDSLRKQTSTHDLLDHVKRSVPNEFGLHEILEEEIRGRDRYLFCFRYPRSQGLPTDDYPAALGDYHLMRGMLDGLKPKELTFIPDDEPYIDDVYPGSLGSYKGRIRFLEETLAGIDLVKLREEKFIKFLNKPAA